MALTPEIKIGGLLGRFPADVQVLVTCTVAVVPSGMSLSGPNISLDNMHLEAVSETVLRPVRTLGCRREQPLGMFGAMDKATTAAKVTPPSGGQGCQLRTAACSPVTSDGIASRGAVPAPGTGRLFAGSN